MAGSFDILTDMFIVKCVPILNDTITKKRKIPSIDPTCFSILCKSTLKISELDIIAVNILGYEKDELVYKKSLYELINVKSLETIKSIHKSSKYQLVFELI